VRLQREQSLNGAPPQEADRRAWIAMFDGYIGDWPIRWYWPTWEQGGNPEWIARNAAERLAYSMQFSGDAEKKRLLEQTANRFAGAPERVAHLGRQAQQQGDAGGKKQVYQDAIRANPNAWEPYHALGLLAIEVGDYTGALETFHSYPGFSAAGKQDEVALSQYAYEAGSDLYWRGAIDQAVPLYQRSAGYATGSHGSMASALRLKLLEGDYRGAAQESLARAQRYDSAYAYRDFLAILHVLGYSKDAWPAFDALMEKFENPQLWASAYVGKRVAGARDNDVERWLRAEPVKSASANGYRFAPNFAVLWYVVDRKPGPGFAKLVEQLDSPPQNFVAAGNNAWTVRGDPVANPEGGGLPLVGPSGYKAQGRPKRPEGMVLRSTSPTSPDVRAHARRTTPAPICVSRDGRSLRFRAPHDRRWRARPPSETRGIRPYLDRAPPGDPVRLTTTCKAFAGARKHAEAVSTSRPRSTYAQAVS
jgi:tetratricopeptide (TPR) repeat protein